MFHFSFILHFLLVVVVVVVFLFCFFFLSLFSFPIFISIFFPNSALKPALSCLLPQHLTKGQPLPRQWGFYCCYWYFPDALFLPRPRGAHRGVWVGVPGMDWEAQSPKEDTRALVIQAVQERVNPLEIPSPSSDS